MRNVFRLRFTAFKSKKKENKDKCVLFQGTRVVCFKNHPLSYFQIILKTLFEIAKGRLLKRDEKRVSINLNKTK